MRRALGIRVEPSSIHWAVLEGTRDTPILVDDDKAAAPVQFGEAQTLSWYRERILHVIDKFHPAVLAVRYEEPRSRARG